MTALSRKVGKISICAGILIAAAAFFLAGIFNPPRMVVSGAPAGGGGGSVSSISIDPTIDPNPVTVGQMLSVGGSVSVVGGPAPVTFTVTVPSGDGGTYEASFTTTFDENGLYGFQAPPFKAPDDPGTQSVTIQAEAGGVTESKTITLTIEPSGATP